VALGKWNAIGLGLIIRASQMEVGCNAAAGVLTGDLGGLRLDVLIRTLTAGGTRASTSQQGWLKTQMASQLRDSGRFTLLFPPYFQRLFSVETAATLSVGFSIPQRYSLPSLLLLGDGGVQGTEETRGLRATQTQRLVNLKFDCGHSLLQPLCVSTTIDAAIFEVLRKTG
jgi:hypothetical protein